MPTLTRRQFATGLAAPLILGAANKSGSSKPVTGEGDHKYEVHHDWGQLPPSIRYGNTHGVCQDSHGRVYIHHTVNASSESHDTMVVFDHKGKFIRSWGKEFKGSAHGLHIRKEGRAEFLYLCDTERAVMVKTTLEGEHVMTIGVPKESGRYNPGPDGKTPKYSPTNVAVAPNGDIYIADGYGSNWIHQYDAKGGYIRTFGGTGKEPGEVNCPHGLIVDTRGGAPTLLVADRTNKRLQRFTLDGRHVEFIGGTNLPCHFHAFRNGDMVVPDLAARVTILDRGNKVAAQLGEDASNTWGKLRKQPREDFPPGKFICPHSACFDHDGNIFVVEWVEIGRVSWLRRVS